MSTESATTDNGTDSDDSDDSDDAHWRVSDDGMELRKVGYETYELATNGVVVRFGDVREDDGAYDLRHPRKSHKSVGTFAPEAHVVPDRVADAFRVLAGELA